MVGSPRLQPFPPQSRDIQAIAPGCVGGSISWVSTYMYMAGGKVRNASRVRADEREVMRWDGDEAECIYGIKDNRWEEGQSPHACYTDS